MRSYRSQPKWCQVGSGRTQGPTTTPLTYLGGLLIDCLSIHTAFPRSARPRAPSPRSGAPVLCCYCRCHPPVSAESCLPVPSSLTAVVSTPVPVETPNLPLLQSLNKVPDRQNLRRRPLRLHTPPANICTPPNRRVHLAESHQHDLVRALTRPTRPRQDR